MSELLHYQLSQKVVKAAFSVHNILGPGLLESCYEGAMVVELEYQQCTVERQKIYPVYYRGQMAGAYVADLVVDDTLILELKSVQALCPAMEAQLLNYLRLSKLQLGYLMNFQGTKLQFKRFINT